MTADAQGNIYFGFTVSGANPPNLAERHRPHRADGIGTWSPAATASATPTIGQVRMNSAPALSATTERRSTSPSARRSTGFRHGYLSPLDAAPWRSRQRAPQRPAQRQRRRVVSDDGTASPTVGPDGDVYFGVLEATFCVNNGRGWLLHFNADLTQPKTPGAFGWDDTASIVPASLVPSYSGTSSYLVMTKYNNYAGIGSGDGVNKLAVLDPNATQADPHLRRCRS